MPIKIVSPADTKVDGESAGAIVSVLLNYPNSARELQTAIEAWYSELIATNQAAQDTLIQLQSQNLALEEKVKQSEAALASAQSQHEAQVADLTTQLEALRNPPKPAQDWQQAISGLETLLLAKCLEAGKTSTAVNMSLSHLMILFAAQRSDAIPGAIADLIQEMEAAGQPITPEEQQQVQDILQASGLK